MMLELHIPVLCSDAIDDCICNVAVMDSFVSSDHKPLAVTFNSLTGLSTPVQETNAGGVNNSGFVIDWTKADDSCIQSYMQTLDSMLSHINIPLDVLSEGGGSNTLKFKSDAYYASIMSCVMKPYCKCLPIRCLN